MEKVLLRLDLLEKAFSSLSSSNKVNEDSMCEVKKTIESVACNLNEKLQESEQKANQTRKEQSEQLKDLHNKIKDQNKKVKSFTKLLQEMKERNDEQYEELVHDVSSCNDVVTVLQSNYSGMSRDLETVTNRCKDVDSDVISLKSSLQTLTTSCNLISSSIELVEQKEMTQIEQLQTKVQTLQEQNGNSNVLLLKHQNTLRVVIQSCVKKQETNVKRIQHLESEMKMVSIKQDSLKQPIGFLASNYDTERVVNGCLRIARSYDSTKLNELHDRNTELMLKGFGLGFYNSDSDYNPKTGIFKVEYDGLYLIYADIFGLDTSQHIYLGFVIREKNKIATLFKYRTIDIVDEKAHFVKIIDLKRGQEICIFQDEVDRSSFGDFACILVS